MQSPPVTVNELLAENRRLREQHAIEVAELKRERAEQDEKLRDRFAMHAPDPGTVTGGTKRTGETFEEWATRRARAAYAYANAMMSVREEF